MSILATCLNVDLSILMVMNKWLMVIFPNSILPYDVNLLERDQLLDKIASQMTKDSGKDVSSKDWKSKFV